MKKTLSKIKVCLATVWIAIISFSSKVMGQELYGSPQFFEPEYGIEYNPKVQGIYGVPSPEPESIAIKIIQILLAAVIFIVGIINLLRIIKINDKTLKKKKIRNTIIIISILVLLLIATFIIPTLLLTK